MSCRCRTLIQTRFKHRIQQETGMPVLHSSLCSYSMVQDKQLINVVSFSCPVYCLATCACLIFTFVFAQCFFSSCLLGVWSGALLITLFIIWEVKQHEMTPIVKNSVHKLSFLLWVWVWISPKLFLFLLSLTWWNILLIKIP